MNKVKSQKMVMAAMLAALTCVATMVIRVPSLGVNGYVNVGDTIVLMCAWLMGGWYGAMAAGIGSAFADLLAGYFVYVPGTFMIKSLMVVIACLIQKVMLSENESTFGMTAKTNVGKFFQKNGVKLLAGIFAEAWMVVGYLIYEAFCLGYGVAAVPAIISNVFQGITNIVLALLLIQIFENVGIKRLINRSVN